MGLLGDIGLLILGISVALFLYSNSAVLGEIAEALRGIGNEMKRRNDHIIAAHMTAEIRRERSGADT